MNLASGLDQKIDEWVSAHVIDLDTAARIRNFESGQQGSARARWPIVLALAFGGLMLGAGVLLFVAAHWDQLSPTQRMLIVLVMVSGFHLAGGYAMPKLRALGVTLHALGTVSLGAGIFLAGQIFNLQEHWPGGILLWALGAVLAWFVLRDSVQATLAAILVPVWLASDIAVRGQRITYTENIVAHFVAMVAFVYLTATYRDTVTQFRAALSTIGSIFIIPAVAAIPLIRPYNTWHGVSKPLFTITAAVLIYTLPIAAAWFLRKRDAVWNIVAAAWLIILGLFNHRDRVQEMAIFVWCAIGSILLVWWGIRESRTERVNLGVAGFGITVIAFYFSAVMDKLGRSASLISFGLLFLLGGWSLEKLRRRLVLRTHGGAA